MSPAHVAHGVWSDGGDCWVVYCDAGCDLGTTARQPTLDRAVKRAELHQIAMETAHRLVVGNTICACGHWTDDHGVDQETRQLVCQRDGCDGECPPAPCENCGGTDHTYRQREDDGSEWNEDCVYEPAFDDDGRARSHR